MVEVVMNVLKETILWRIRIVYNVNATSREDQRKVEHIDYVLRFSMTFININSIVVLRVLK